MRLLFPTTIVAITLFLGGCFHIPVQPPASPPTEQPTTPPPNTTNKAESPYPPDTSIEGKTALRYTADGKKIYNNPELGLYFEYSRGYDIYINRFVNYNNDPVFKNNVGKQYQIYLRDKNDGTKGVDININSKKLFIENYETVPNLMEKINLKSIESENIQNILPASVNIHCKLESHNTNYSFTDVRLTKYSNNEIEVNIGLTGLAQKEKADLPDLVVSTHLDSVIVEEADEIIRKCNKRIAGIVENNKLQNNFLAFFTIMNSLSYK